MEKKFKLAVTPNYGKVIWKIIILLLTCVILPPILFGISIEKGLINPNEIKFEFVLAIYLIIVVIITFLVFRKTYFKDTVTLTDKSLDIPKMRNIDYNEIIKNKAFTVSGATSYIITLKEGRKLAIGPINNFSSSADITFKDFIIEFEKKVAENEQTKKSITPIASTFPGILSEGFQDFKNRYDGFGKELYSELLKRKPELLQKITFYKLPQQPTDSFAIYDNGEKSIGIQLDPEIERIVLWNNSKQTEIGDWSEDCVKEAIEYIETELWNE